MNEDLQKIFQETLPDDSIEIIPIFLVCKFFGIKYDIQSKSLNVDDSYKEDMFKASDKELYGDDIKRIYLSKNGFIRWILQMSSLNIKSNLNLFSDYQKNLINYLFTHAYNQQRLLLKVDSLKNRKDELYKILHAERKDFVEYIDVQAEIMRLGKESKAIQQTIVHTSQTKLF